MRRPLRALALAFPAALAAGGWGAAAARADTVVLQGGKKLENVTVSRNDDVVVVNPWNSRCPEMTWEIPDKNRYPREKVLAGGYAAQAVAMFATGLTMVADAPPPLTYALAAVAASSLVVTRPTQSALVPSLAVAPEDCTAANGASGFFEGGGSVDFAAAPLSLSVDLPPPFDFFAFDVFFIEGFSLAFTFDFVFAISAPLSFCRS